MYQGGWQPKLLHHAAIIVVFVIGIFSLSLTQPVGNYNLPPVADRSYTPTAMTTPSDTPTPSPSATPAPTPAPTPATPAPTSAAPARTFGIAAGSDLTSLPPAALQQRLAAIKAMGVNWIRYDIEWSNIEFEGPGRYNWTDYDRVVQAAQAAGLQSLAILDYSPPWARPAACADTAMCAPADPAAYGRFVSAAVNHYRPYGVRTWEIWNEPNNANYFRPHADPAAYTRLLQAAYPAIKRIDPGATVITGGTSPADTYGDDLNPPDFVRGIYRAGARGYFDALSHHPYTYPFTPKNAYAGGAWSQLIDLRNIMVANGDGNKKVWATEYGAPTNGPDRTAVPGQWPLEGGWQVSEGLQAIMVADAIAAYRRYSWTGPLFWYTFQDGGTDRSTAEHFFGLLRSNGSHKPAYDAFVRAIK